MDILIILAVIAVFWAFFGELVIAIFENIFGLLSAIWEILTDIFDFFVDLKNKLVSFVSNRKKQSNIQAHKKILDKRKKQYRTFTSADELPKDLELLDSLLEDLIHSGDCTRTLICARAAAKMGSKAGAYNTAKLMMDNAQTPEERMEALVMCELAIARGSIDAKKLHEKILKRFAFSIGMDYYKQNDFESAAKFFKIAGEHGDGNGYLNYGKLLAQRATTAEEWKEAEDWGIRAMECGILCEDFCNICKSNQLLRKGMYFEHKTQFDEAIDCYIEAANLNSAPAAKRAALLLVKHAASIEDLSVAAALTEIAEDHNQMTEDQAEEIIHLYEKKLALINDFDSEAIVTLQNNDFEESLKICMEGIDAGSSFCAYYAARIYHKLSNFEKAESFAKLAWHMERRSRNIEGLEEFMHKCIIDHNLDRAFKAIERGDRSTGREYLKIAADAGSNTAIDLLAMDLFQHAQTEEEYRNAKPWIDKARLTNPIFIGIARTTDANLAIFMGNKALKHKQYKEAVAHYRTAYDLTPSKELAEHIIDLTISRVAETWNEWNDLSNFVEIAELNDEKRKEYFDVIYALRYDDPEVHRERRRKTNMKADN